MLKQQIDNLQFYKGLNITDSDEITNIVTAAFRNLCNNMKTYTGPGFEDYNDDYIDFREHAVYWGISPDKEHDLSSGWAVWFKVLHDGDSVYLEWEAHVMMSAGWGPPDDGVPADHIPAILVGFQKFKQEFTMMTGIPCDDLVLTTKELSQEDIKELTDCYDDDYNDEDDDYNDEAHIACSSYPNCDIDPLGCVVRYGDDAEMFGHKD